MQIHGCPVEWPRRLDLSVLCPVAEEDCPELALRPKFLCMFGPVSDQIAKMGMGTNKKIIAYYENYQVSAFTGLASCPLHLQCCIRSLIIGHRVLRLGVLSVVQSISGGCLSWSLEEFA